jgi:hypothetical protein
MDKPSDRDSLQPWGLTCRSLRWRDSLVGTAEGSLGLDLCRGAGIDVSMSEISETPSSGSKSMGSSRWSPCAFDFPFSVPFAGFGWGMADLRWAFFERDGAGASSLSVRMIGSALPWAFSSDLAWMLERRGAAGLDRVADFLAVWTRQFKK